jgi:hypothetical protein
MAAIPMNAAPSATPMNQLPQQYGQPTFNQDMANRQQQIAQFNDAQQMRRKTQSLNMQRAGYGNTALTPPPGGITVPNPEASAAATPANDWETQPLTMQTGGWLTLRHRLPRRHTRPHPARPRLPRVLLLRCLSRLPRRAPRAYRLRPVRFRRQHRPLLCRVSTVRLPSVRRWLASPQGPR